jgi:hypothetical protein
MSFQETSYEFVFKADHLEQQLSVLYLETLLEIA